MVASAPGVGALSENAISSFTDPKTGYLGESVNINKEETAAMMKKSDQFAEGSLLGTKLPSDKNAAFDVTKGLTPNMTTEGIHKTNRDDPHMESGLKSLGKDTDWMAILQTLAKVASA